MQIKRVTSQTLTTMYNKRHIMSQEGVLKIFRPSQEALPPASKILMFHQTLGIFLRTFQQLLGYKNEFKHEYAICFDPSSTIICQLKPNSELNKVTS